MFILSFSLFIHRYQSISAMPWNKSIESATKAKMSAIAVFCVLADQWAPVFPVHTAISRQTVLLLLSLWVAGSKIPPRRSNAIDMELQITIGQSDVHDGRFTFWYERGMGTFSKSQLHLGYSQKPDCCQETVNNQSTKLFASPSTCKFWLLWCRKLLRSFHWGHYSTITVYSRKVWCQSRI